MDKSSVTWTEGSDWWLSRTTMGGKERYPKQIRVGHLDRPRVYYPINRDGLLTVAEMMDQDAFLYREAARSFIECGNHDAAEICYEAASEYNDYAKAIREELGVSGDE